MFLGHRNSKTTDIYINLEQALFTSTTDEWITRASHNETEVKTIGEENYSVEEANNMEQVKALLSKGYKNVMDFKGVKLFTRKITINY